MALAYLQQARNPGPPGLRESALDQATKYAAEVRAFAREFGDVLFLSNALILESRIARSRGRALAAEDFARDALENGYDRIFVRIDALIARGEARLDSGNRKGASEDFEAALELGSENPKVAAACHLHLMRAFAHMNDVKHCMDHKKEWDRLKGRVKNAFLLRLEERALLELVSITQDFVVKWSAPDLNREKFEPAADFSPPKCTNSSRSAGTAAPLPMAGRRPGRRMPGRAACGGWC